MMHDIVVYQFGKVASTSLVATLNSLPNVEAVQAHFLGRDSLKEMVDVIVDPASSDYFHKHQVGQFNENARTTRMIQAHRQGLARDRRLSIITLCRDPFDWFRSSLVQDMTGYLPVLDPLAPEAEDSGEERIRRALEGMFDRFHRIATEFGGIDALQEKLRANQELLSGHPALTGNRGLLGMFYMMLRPFSWFEAHYRPALGQDIAGFRDVGGGLLFHNAGWARLVVLRYEDIATQIGPTAGLLGLGSLEALRRENLSGSKDMYQSVHQAFGSEAARMLRELFADTTYSRRFGYV